MLHAEISLPLQFKVQITVGRYQSFPFQVRYIDGLTNLPILTFSCVAK